MPAYIIVVAKVHDRAAFLKAYGGPAAELTTRLGGRYLLRGPGAIVLEQPKGQPAWGDGAGVVVSEWPDMRSLRAFWDSPEYAELKRAREGLADVQVLAIETLA